MNQLPSNERCLGLQTSNTHKNSQDRLSRSKVFFWIMAIFVIQLYIGFTWPINYIHYGTPDLLSTQIYAIYLNVNSHTLLPDIELSLLCALIIIFGLDILIHVARKYALQSSYKPESHIDSDSPVGIDSTENELNQTAPKNWLIRQFEGLRSKPNFIDHAFLIALIGALIVYTLWFMAGINFWELRAGNIFVPLIETILFLWLGIFCARQSASCKSLLAFAFILGVFSLWTGIVLGANADYETYVWTYFEIGLGIIFVFLILGVLIPETRKAKLFKENVENNSEVMSSSDAIAEQEKEQERSSNESGRIDQNVHYKHSWVTNHKIIRTANAVVLCGLILTSFGIVYTAVNQSITNFHVLANIQNCCIFYQADQFNRVDQNFIPGFGTQVNYIVDNNISLEMARNEYNSVQIVMLPINQKYFSLYDIEFSGFFNQTGDLAITSDATQFQAYNNEYVDSIGDLISRYARTLLAYYCERW